MKRTLPLFLVVLLFPLIVIADGGVYPKTALQAKVTIPDQRALVCWSNGVEKLAIDTRFIGEGTNFAWVVPLPGPPVIEEATTGLFNTLEYIFRPAIAHRIAPIYAFLLFFTGVGYLLIYVRRNTEPRISDLVVSVLTAVAILPISACVAIPLALLLPWSVWRVRAGLEGLWLIIGVLFFLFIFSSMLLPALGTAGVAASPSNKVTVLNHQMIGEYDTTTLASKDPAALVQWLSENNYAAPTGVEKVVSNYVNRGWVFVATKLRREPSAASESSPQPLCFTFHTDRPIYPMQLTGIGNTNLEVELFIFGPSRAQAKYFRAGRCAIPNFSDSGYSPANFKVVHPLLRKWTLGSSVATKLTAKLTPDQMNDDVEINWVPYKELHQTLYSGQGAAIFAFNWGSGLFCGGLFIGSIATALKRDWQKYLISLVAIAAIAGLAIAAALLIALPKTEVRLVRFPVVYSRRDLGKLELEYSFGRTNGSSPEKARAALAKMASTKENILLGGNIREEDSPGNYLLRETTNGVDFISFDRDGGAHTNEL